MNPLYEQMRNQQNMNGFMQRLEYLKRTFHGDPNAKIQEMLNSGQITQEQYNRAVQQASQIQRLLGGR